MSPTEGSKEDILDVVGGDGLWQRYAFLVVVVGSVPFACHNLVFAFYAPNLPHWCARPLNTTLTAQEWVRTGLPPHDTTCSRYGFTDDPSYHDGFNRSVVRCTSWEYNESYTGVTLLSKFNLVCEREWLISFSKSILNIGFLASATLLGFLSDRFGRKPTIVWCNVTTLVCSVACAFSPTFLLFTLCRVGLAVGLIGLYTNAFVLLMELVGPEQRSVYGSLKTLGWSTGFVLLAGVAYILRDYFWIQMAITLPSVLLLASWWMLLESPRWLLARGRLDEAHTTLCKMANANGIDPALIKERLKGILMETHREHRSERSNNGVCALLRSPSLRKKTLNVFCLWFVVGFVYYGISYNTNELAGDMFLNFAISGLVEFPGILLALVALRLVGRRKVVSGLLLTVGAASILLYLTPTDVGWLRQTLSIVSKMCILVCFVVAHVFTAELFPTRMRNLAVGSASSCSRLASILAPFARELGQATNPLVPQALFGVMAASSGLLVLLLPETKDLHVPDTLEDASRRSRRQSDQKCGNTKEKEVHLNGKDCRDGLLNESSL